MEHAALLRPAAVIAAAGSDNLSQKFGSITALQRMIRTLQRVEADPIVVVTGYQADVIQKQVAPLHAICIYNKDWEQSDLFASAKLGLDYVKDLCDVVFFTPAAIPLFSTDTAAALLSEASAPASLPITKGRRGHPLLLQSSLIPALLAYEGEGGIPAALRALGIARHEVLVEDEGVLFNTKYQTEDSAWEELVVRQNAQPPHMELQITLSQELPFFDAEAAAILRLISRTQSVREACRQMNLSYSKGWKLLNAMEAQLHFAVVVRNPGGNGGGCTYLTPKGRDFLEKYERLQRETLAFSKEAYRRIFASS
ncbi:MAG: NTP transferase domain-containing protein [bacterium]|nr:NTP transferase domain-containing protein [bacterium]